MDRHKLHERTEQEVREANKHHAEQAEQYTQGIMQKLSSAVNQQKLEIDWLRQVIKLYEDRFGPMDGTITMEQINNQNKARKVGHRFADLGLEIGKIVDIKNMQYGDSTRKSGEILAILYPNGVKPDQYRDMLLMVRIIDKLFRVANGNQGDEDAYSDIAGYGILGVGKK